MNQKLRFLSLYPLCPCLIKDGDELIPDLIEGFDYIQGTVICERVNHDPENISLLLTPFSELSLEHAKLLVKMLSITGDAFTDDRIISTMIDIVLGKFHYHELYLSMQTIISKMREFNYAYPFEGIGVGVQQDMGWIKLK